VKSNTAIGTIATAEPSELNEPKRPSRYRGRFAPSPSGALHFGSLVAATASYLSARQAGGDWLLRIEDLDPPRVVPGSARQIIAALRTLGFQWDEPIAHQSTRGEAYQAALSQLLSNGLAYACSCSRSELMAAQATAPEPGSELHYPGWCRGGPRHPESPLAIRLRVGTTPIGVQDAIQGYRRFDVAREVGDFVIRRRDGLYAYQLAVVVDDAAQGITHVVRGTDLWNSTPRQMILQRGLGLPTPKYAHVPLAMDANGVKLSKSAGAAVIDMRIPTMEVWRALRFLRQDPPPDLRLGGIEALWEWAIRYWRVQPLHELQHAGVNDPP